jgi:hypothetical protein
MKCLFFLLQVKNNQMIRLTKNHLLKNRYALATVITTLIILVVSILLAGVLTYFATNVVSTRVQQESLAITNAHIWVPATAAVGSVEGALMITNTGGRDVVISQIQVLGQPCTNMYFLDTVQADDLNQALAYTPANTGPTLNTVAVGTFHNALATDPGSLVLPSGHTMVVYILSPASVSVNDIGITVGFTAFTAQAMYYKETNVQSYAGP